MGGELTSEEDLCQSVGLLIHYFTLTSSLWLTISSSIIYRKLINPTDKPVRHINPYVVTPEVGRLCQVGWLGRLEQQATARKTSITRTARMVKTARATKKAMMARTD